MHPTLAGLRVLVVEDEMLVSLMIEDILAEQFCRVVGPFDRVPAALDAARTAAIDVALLDVNVAGSKVYPVAEMLQIRNVPFLLLSGYGLHAVPRDHLDWKVCSKPFSSGLLVGMLHELVHVA